MTAPHQFVRVQFSRFKAFQSFTLTLRHFNILVGPNNAGKSTILAAFRILAAAMRKAHTRNPTLVRGPFGNVLGHAIDLGTISVAEENLFFNYDDSLPASVTFTLSNANVLQLYFPEHGVCYLIPDGQGRPIRSTAIFKSQFDCPIGYVPILGPVEHHEPLYEREAARLALFNYRSARNFRNIWFHFPEKFPDFRRALAESWPGMDIEAPVLDYSHDKPRLHMFCPEERIPREIFWSGFGFQVWCQMLTHLIQSKTASLFLIDEPDIYLHSELQRQLLSLLKGMGPDILLATHSTEIISEAETDDIVVVNKKRTHARRIKNPKDLEEVFGVLGSNLNPTLSQLAKTKRAVFVEGKDFQVISRFAQRLGQESVGNRRDFAVVPVEGFNPERIRILKGGMESTLGAKVQTFAILDRDYRSKEECHSIAEECRSFCDHVAIHQRKEIENFLLVPTALDRAAARKVTDRARRTGSAMTYAGSAAELLNRFADDKKNYIMAQFLSSRRSYERRNSPTLHESQVSQAALEAFDSSWADADGRLLLVPGKEALSFFNSGIQRKYGIAVTPGGIVEAMLLPEIPKEMEDLIAQLAFFSRRRRA